MCARKALITWVPLTHQRSHTAMRHQARLLLDRLDLHEPHGVGVAPPHRFSGVSGIVLVATT